MARVGDRAAFLWGSGFRPLLGTYDGWEVPLPLRVDVHGADGAAITAGLGAADQLFVDRIAAGWRPNQFVEGKLKPFTTLAG
jgi:hypothetical protein